MWWILGQLIPCNEGFKWHATPSFENGVIELLVVYKCNFLSDLWFHWWDTWSDQLYVCRELYIVDIRVVVWVCQRILTMLEKSASKPFILVIVRSIIDTLIGWIPMRVTIIVLKWSVPYYFLVLSPHDRGVNNFLWIFSVVSSPRLREVCLWLPCPRPSWWCVYYCVNG